MQAISSFRLWNNFSGLCFQKVILAAVWRMECKVLRSDTGRPVRRWLRLSGQEVMRLRQEAVDSSHV